MSGAKKGWKMKSKYNITGRRNSRWFECESCLEPQDRTPGATKCDACHEGKLRPIDKPEHLR